jgi:hypothetical protein
MFQIQKINGKNKGSINQKKRTATIAVRGTNINIIINPLPILPA